MNGNFDTTWRPSSTPGDVSMKFAFIHLFILMKLIHCILKRISKTACLTACIVFKLWILKLNKIFVNVLVLA